MRNSIQEFLIGRISRTIKRIKTWKPRSWGMLTKKRYGILEIQHKFLAPVPVTESIQPGTGSCAAHSTHQRQHAGSLTLDAGRRFFRVGVLNFSKATGYFSFRAFSSSLCHWRGVRVKKISKSWRRHLCSVSQVEIDYIPISRVEEQVGRGPYSVRVRNDAFLRNMDLSIEINLKAIKSELYNSI